LHPFLTRDVASFARLTAHRRRGGKSCVRGNRSGSTGMWRFCHATLQNRAGCDEKNRRGRLRARNRDVELPDGEPAPTIFWSRRLSKRDDPSWPSRPRETRRSLAVARGVPDGRSEQPAPPHRERRAMNRLLQLTLGAMLMSGSFGCSSLCPWSRSTAGYAQCAPMTSCAPVVDPCGGAPAMMNSAPMIQGAPATIVPSPEVYTPVR